MSFREYLPTAKNIASPASPLKQCVRGAANILRLFLITLFIASPGVRAQERVPLRLIDTIPLPNVRGRIDHFDVDLKHRRLFMSALGNGTLEVFDLRTNKRINTIRDLREPQGVTYASRSNRIFVANGGDGTVRIFDGSTLKLLKVVRLSSDADDTRYARSTDRVIVGYGDKGNAGLAVFDGAGGDLLRTIKLPGHPESFQLEESGQRIFVNIPTAGGIVDVVSRKEHKTVAKWALHSAGRNFPMALDEDHHVLFIVCRRPSKLLVFDTKSGKIIAHVASAGDADDVWYDAARRRIYISGGEGLISVIAQVRSDQYRSVARIKTAIGARTSQFVPQLNRFYLAVPRHGNNPARLEIYAID